MFFSRHDTIIIRNVRQFSFSACFETDVFQDFELKFQVPGDAQAFAENLSREAQKLLVPAERVGYRRSPTAPPGRNSYF